MMLKAILLALAAAAGTHAAPAKAPASTAELYSKQWVHEARVNYALHPNRPAYDAASLKFEASSSKSGLSFSCKAYADDGVVPSDVRHVRPKDISTILAIGDSITAGFGMNDGTLPFTSLDEYRGLAFSIGGDSGAVTIPNFLEVYNPKLAGESTGTTSLGAKIDVLNAAVSGAKVADLTGQVAQLVSAFNGGSYNVNGWKMLNVLIGANNVCNVCNDATTNGAAAFETGFRSAMQALQGNFTNLIVNAIGIFDVSQVHGAQQASGYCRFIQGLLNECKCAANSYDLMKATAVQYNQAMQKVAGEFQNSNTFVVNYQPGASNIQGLTLNDLAKVDCFHPNQASNEKVAGFIWNNLFQPAGSKVDNYQLTSFNSIYCPSSTDYFQ